jgi:hypothetical protein
MLNKLASYINKLDHRFKFFDRAIINIFINYIKNAIKIKTKHSFKQKCSK